MSQPNLPGVLGRVWWTIRWSVAFIIVMTALFMVGSYLVHGRWPAWV